MKRFKGTKGAIVLLLLFFMLIAYYFYLSNRNRGVVEEESNVEATRVQDILIQDLERNYPATPKEVIKYYSEITQCVYNEEYTEEELERLSNRALELYDSELANMKSKEAYLKDLKADVSKFKQEKIVVSSYRVSNSTDVKYFTVSGRECAGLYCTYTLRKGTSLEYTQEVFILRKDEVGHWKILGWDLADERAHEIDAP